MNTRWMTIFTPLALITLVMCLAASQANAVTAPTWRTAPAACLPDRMIRWDSSRSEVDQAPCHCPPPNLCPSTAVTTLSAFLNNSSLPPAVTQTCCTLPTCPAGTGLAGQTLPLDGNCNPAPPPPPPPPGGGSGGGGGFGGGSCSNSNVYSDHAVWGYSRGPLQAFTDAPWHGGGTTSIYVGGKIDVSSSGGGAYNGDAYFCSGVGGCDINTENAYVLVDNVYNRISLSGVSARITTVGPSDVLAAAQELFGSSYNYTLISTEGSQSVIYACVLNSSIYGNCLGAESQVTYADGHSGALGDVRRGDVLRGPEGDAVVEAVSRLDQESRFFRLNDLPLTVSGDHPVRTTAGWKTVVKPEGKHPGLVGQLVVGDVLVTAEGNVPVTAITPLPLSDAQAAMNLRTRGDKPYFAGGVAVKPFHAVTYRY